MTKIQQSGKFHFVVAGYGAAVPAVAEALLGEIDDFCEKASSALSRRGWSARAEPGEPPGVELTALITDGKTLWHVARDLTPTIFDEPYMAIGSGGEFAAGALAAGATPERAIEIAAQLDASCGDGLQVVHVAKRKR